MHVKMCGVTRVVDAEAAVKGRGDGHRVELRSREPAAHRGRLRARHLGGDRRGVRRRGAGGSGWSPICRSRR